MGGQWFQLDYKDHPFNIYRMGGLYSQVGTTVRKEQMCETLLNKCVKPHPTFY